MTSVADNDPPSIPLFDRTGQPLGVDGAPHPCLGRCRGHPERPGRCGACDGPVCRSCRAYPVTHHDDWCGLCLGT